ncbi:hypothetical protein FN846DRAFT_914017 [Sphaerosporella brunnea]|uniref:Uncharacterized protein n=1 Tax=Sphaerosporella brunnea TaxID=1250544 RepID=A0A5J5ED03_9PEZI|nr:hypothetical protein FN846DRAFT_914017 [Sphaerosporella brunnea]
MSYVIACLVAQDSLHSFRTVQMLLEAGAQLTETRWLTIIKTGNHQLFSQLAQNVPRAQPNLLGKPSPTPTECVRTLVDAKVPAGADQDAMWVDRVLRHSTGDTDRMAYYWNWMARKLLAEIKRTGRL